LTGYRFEVISLLSRIKMLSALMDIFKMIKKIVLNVRRVVSDALSQTNASTVLKIFNLLVVLSFHFVLWNVSKDNIARQSMLLPLIFWQNFNRIQKLILNFQSTPSICFKLVWNVQLVVVIVTHLWTNKVFSVTIVVLDTIFNSMDSASKIQKI
jgi:hypothetical protein